MGTVYTLPITDIFNNRSSEMAANPNSEQLAFFNAMASVGYHLYNGPTNIGTMNAYIAANAENTIAFYPYNYGSSSRLVGVGFVARVNGNIGHTIMTTSNYWYHFTNRNPTDGFIHADLGITDASLSAFNVDMFATQEEAESAVGYGNKYPITYHYENSTVSGPAEAVVGDAVTVSAVPDVDYGITDQSSQIAVTCNDEPVAFSWDATNQRITFTMPDPS